MTYCHMTSQYSL